MQNETENEEKKKSIQLELKRMRCDSILQQMVQISFQNSFLEKDRYNQYFWQIHLTTCHVMTNPI